MAKGRRDGLGEAVCTHWEKLTSEQEKYGSILGLYSILTKNSRFAQVTKQRKEHIHLFLRLEECRKVSLYGGGQ